MGFSTISSLGMSSRPYSLKNSSGRCCIASCIGDLPPSDFLGIEVDVASIPDNTAPTVTSTQPTGPGISLTTNTLSISFSEAMDTKTSGSVSLETSGTGSAVVSGTPAWSNGNKTVTYSLSGLAFSSTYTYSISGFKDVAGNTMDPDGSTTFTTLADTTKPAVTSITAQGGNSAAAVEGTLTIRFSKAMDTAAGTGAVSLDEGETNLLPGTWTEGGTVYTVGYTGLSYSTLYFVTVSGFRDTALVPNTMDPDSSTTFTTLAGPVSLPISVEGGSIYTKGTNIPMVFKAEKDISLYSHTLVNGNVLTASEVVITSGSTVATLQNSFLETLAAGTHRIELHFTDGTFAGGSFEIKAASAADPAPTPVPKTPVSSASGASSLAKSGDSTSFVFPITLGIFALLTLGAIVMIRHKRNEI